MATSLHSQARFHAIALCTIIAAGTACESTIPAGDRPRTEGADVEQGPSSGQASGYTGSECKSASDTKVMLRGCSVSVRDYTPRDSASIGTRFPACISDDNTYHSFNADVPSNSRIAAFEAMAKLLGFGTNKALTPKDFETARVLYTQPEGLDSRVQRREDIHFPPAPKACKDFTTAEAAAFPDRCAGSAKLVPLIQDALLKGTQGIELSVQAARIEAALIWFMWLSFFKESQGCGTRVDECDSTSAYWGGSQERNADATGYGRYVRAISEESYQRGWDAVLAVRCWRDQDNPTGNAMNAMLQAQARDQVDRINNHALALVIRQKLLNLSCGSAWASVKILGSVLDVVARPKDPEAARRIRDELAKPDGALVDKAQLDGLLDTLFGCP